MSNNQKQMVKLQKTELTLRKKRYSLLSQKAWNSVKNGRYKMWRDIKCRLL